MAVLFFVAYVDILPPSKFLFVFRRTNCTRDRKK